MNKLMILLFTFLLTPISYASLAKANKYFKANSEKNADKIMYELMRSKYYFSAAEFAKKVIISGKPINKNMEKRLVTLILKTGTLSFTGLDENILKGRHSKALNFILGLKYFNDGRYKEAAHALRKPGKRHRFSPESLMILGASLNIINKDKNAIKAYKSCIKSAKHFENKANNVKLKRYYTIIKESCYIHIARMYFKIRKYKKSVHHYEEIPKTSYRWPYILLEKAWAYYYMRDYNRALGVLVTYKSPLLSSYFMPEGEVLSALSYFKMCLYQDTLKVVNNYYGVYKNRSKHLKNILLKHKDSHTYFLKLMLTPIDQNEKANPFIRNLITQIRKQIKFNLDLVNYKKLKNEYKFLKKRKKTPLVKYLAASIRETLNWRTKHLNHYVKKQMFSFINDIHKNSYEMFNIKLEIMSNKRDLIYRNKELVSDRSRGDISNVNRTIDQHFYMYNGEFWADELGDFSFGLKSNCQEVKTDKK